MFLIELILIFFLEEVVESLGINVRWRWHLSKARMLGRPSLAFKPYFRKVARKTIPPNHISKWILSYILGFGIIILGSVLLIRAISKLTDLIVT